MNKNKLLLLGILLLNTTFHVEGNFFHSVGNTADEVIEEARNFFDDIRTFTVEAYHGGVAWFKRLPGHIKEASSEAYEDVTSFLKRVRGTNDYDIVVFKDLTKEQLKDISELENTSIVEVHDTDNTTKYLVSLNQESYHKLIDFLKENEK